ncbi:soluble lytic murein transglycosylase precursor [mine drainage metagenome]|uniref:Soluble lytic murein transglycosylase n=1 Tax=mine drainage metagenome TaxID=410659 RepID=A0A1J5RBW1_9ZZZZ
MPANRLSIPLFDQKPRHSFVPTGLQRAVARSGGPGRPTGRRICALPWTAASTMASLPVIGRKVALVATIVTALLSSSSNGMAQSPPVLMPTERASASSPFADLVAEASQRFSIPSTWIQAVIGIESANDPHALSPKGAMGLMQIMPSTWATWRDRLNLGVDPFDPRANILAGTAFLREMLDRYGSPGFLAAYNAGPARYEDHLATGRPLPAETQAYLAMLSPMLGGKQAGGAIAPVAAVNVQTWRTAALFVRDDTNVGFRPFPDILSATAPCSDGLFVRPGVPEHRP